MNEYGRLSGPGDLDVQEDRAYLSSFIVKFLLYSASLLVGNIIGVCSCFILCSLNVVSSYLQSLRLAKWIARVFAISMGSVMYCPCI